MYWGSVVLFVVLAEVAEEAAQLKGLPQLDTRYFTPQLFWLVVTFVGLFLVMSRIALPRVGDVIEKRRSRIKYDLDAAAHLKDETGKALADYEKALADARADASIFAKEARENLASEIEAEHRRVGDEIAAKLRDADSRVAATQSEALSAIGDIAMETTRALVEKLVGRDVTAEDVKEVLYPIVGE